MDLQFKYVAQALPFLLAGMKLTIIFTVGGLAIGFFLGAIVGLGRTAKNKYAFSAATVYVEVIRGTPILVQAIWIYYAMPQLLGLNLDILPAGITAIAINSGAYIAEVVRGAIEGVPKGQREAGRSLGLNHYHTLYHIIWPQAFRRMIPSLGNQFIISLKDTSLFTIIGAAEMTRQAQISVASNFAYFEIYSLLAVLYLSLTIPITLMLRYVERRLDVN
ncbi:amino acid ABC transporter permease [Metallumcola ferriviriculae]|uniref:Amino acid ABC transporter permease n=1 Tax=Metallumcola ferriviriculae TaxID=3039180 RepID=A0AAU0UQ02_9FIRM|nr:amino acid ABC transporter permease [Desulfitibacteraceae bacterium MK1]